MSRFAVAGIQMKVSSIQSNVEMMKLKLDITMNLYPWVQMVVFSELAPYGPLLSNAQDFPAPAEEVFRGWARKHGIWLVPGSMFERVGEYVFNTAMVIDPQGEVVGHYRKMFPFRPYENGVEAGQEFCVFDVPDVGRFGVSICYDLWFPETSRTLAALGAEVLLHPSMTTTIDRDVELAMVRAAAAQNQCFVVDVNGVGDGGNGRSIVSGPAGDVQYQAGTSEEMIPLEIDFDRVRRSREVGLRGLGQPLKSFRDAPVLFDVYRANSREREYLASLGPLVKPERGSRAGIDKPREETS
jgi:predicted amidohydrolase